MRATKTFFRLSKRAIIRKSVRAARVLPRGDFVIQGDRARHVRRLTCVCRDQSVSRPCARRKSGMLCGHGRSLPSRVGAQARFPEPVRRRLLTWHVRQSRRSTWTARCSTGSRGRSSSGISRAGASSRPRPRFCAAGGACATSCTCRFARTRCASASSATWTACPPARSTASCTSSTARSWCRATEGRVWRSCAATGRRGSTWRSSRRRSTRWRRRRPSTWARTWPWPPSWSATLRGTSPARWRVRSRPAPRRWRASAPGPTSASAGTAGSS